MMSWKLSLLFFSAVTLPGCLSDAPEAEDQDESCITKILTVYNRRDGGPYLYKSYNKRPSVPLKDEENNKGYIIQETECLKSGNPDLSQCDLNPDGDVKACDCDFEDPVDMVCVSAPKKKRDKRGIGKWLSKHKKEVLIGAIILYKIFG